MYLCTFLHVPASSDVIKANAIKAEYFLGLAGMRLITDRFLQVLKTYESATVYLRIQVLICR